MTTRTELNSPRQLPGVRSRRLVVAAGLLGGAAFVADTVTIALINRSFGVLDSVLFFIGLIGLAVALVALAVLLSAGTAGARRLGVGMGAFVGEVVVIGILAQLMDKMGHHVFSPANKGLHGEWSFFTVGVCLLLLAGWANRTRPGPE